MYRTTLTYLRRLTARHSADVRIQETECIVDVLVTLAGVAWPELSFVSLPNLVRMLEKNSLSSSTEINSITLDILNNSNTTQALYIESGYVCLLFCFVLFWVFFWGGGGGGGMTGRELNKLIWILYKNITNITTIILILIIVNIIIIGFNIIFLLIILIKSMHDHYSQQNFAYQYMGAAWTLPFPRVGHSSSGCFCMSSASYCKKAPAHDTIQLDPFPAHLWRCSMQVFSFWFFFGGLCSIIICDASSSWADCACWRDWTSSL